ncbi:hypothetical protein [Ferrimonas marina]|uniref:Uncharacterized protein n=1 Tax=Ferrimonas marina TaxID=299255 RepID=A0A1M5UG04_9GAMM|nr:hypothetical protein [Ferrimonas marina]SHH61871.1 hypothetical protein SAMN02745129_2551 [Ferrimonas marina]
MSTTCTREILKDLAGVAQIVLLSHRGPVTLPQFDKALHVSLKSCYGFGSVTIPTVVVESTYNALKGNDDTLAFTKDHGPRAKAIILGDDPHCDSQLQRFLESVCRKNLTQWRTAAKTLIDQHCTHLLGCSLDHEHVYGTTGMTQNINLAGKSLHIEFDQPETPQKKVIDNRIASPRVQLSLSLPSEADSSIRFSDYFFDTETLPPQERSGCLVALKQFANNAGSVRLTHLPVVIVAGYIEAQAQQHCGLIPRAVTRELLETMAPLSHDHAPGTLGNHDPDTHMLYCGGPQYEGTQAASRSFSALSKRAQDHLNKKDGLHFELGREATR